MATSGNPALANMLGNMFTKTGGAYGGADPFALAKYKTDLDLYKLQEQRAYEQEQARKLAEIANRIYGQEAVPAQLQQYQLSPDETFEGEQIAGLQTQQPGQEATGYFSLPGLTDAQKMVMQIERDKLSSGVPALQEQALEDANLFQKNILPSDKAPTAAPSSVREWQYFNSLSQDDQDRYLEMKRNMPWLDMGTYYEQPGGTMGPGRTTGPIDIRGREIEEARGGDIAQRITDFPKTVASKESFIQSLDTHVDALNRLDETATGWTTGLGGALRFLPETEARNWYNTLEEVQAQTVIDTMKELKELSPTGSTGFGAVNIRELEVMMNKWGKIDQFTEKKQIKEILARRKGIMKQIRSRAAKALEQEKAWYKRNRKSGGQKTQQQGTQAPAGVFNPETGQIEWSD